MINLRAEVQFTTALQHALDTATHDFDFKGGSFDWQNFRVVAQLRGTLELADSILDNVEASAALMEAGVPGPQDFRDAQSILNVLEDMFDAEALPPDRRRMALVVSSWLSALDHDADWLRTMIIQHEDLAHALSLSPVESALGILLRESGTELVAEVDGYFSISSELESLCPETALVPVDRRVVFGSTQ